MTDRLPWEPAPPEPDTPVGGDLVHPYALGRGQGYAATALEREVQRVQQATHGSRNHTLNRAAFSLGQLVAGGELDEELVVRELSAAAELVGLQVREIDPTIRSGLRGGGQHPRNAPRRSHESLNGQHDAAVISTNAGETDETDTDPVAYLRAALVDTDGLDDIPEPEPLVHGLLYRDSIAWLIGPPGHGKSFAALDIAGCVATGNTWQSWPVEQGDVLYLAAEGVSGIRQRVRAWESSMNTRMTGVKFLPIAVQAATPSAWQAFIALCAELEPSLIVVDTQARVTVGMEENSAKDMGEFVHRVEQLRRATAACVTVVHHQGRSGDHMRGSTALEGAATTIVRINKDDDLVSVECAKQKDSAPFEPFKLRLVSHGSSAILSLTDDETPKRTDTPAIRRMIKDWWDSFETDPVSVTNLTETTGIAKATFHRAIKALVRQGIAAEQGQGNMKRYRLTQPPEPP